MNKLFIVNIITIVLLLLCSINKKFYVNSAVALEQSWNNRGIFYPVDSNGQTCEIKMAFYYNTSILSPTVPISITSSSDLVISQINSNSLKKTVFEFTKIVPPDNVQTTIFYTLSDSSGSSSVAAQYLCYGVSLSSGTNEIVKSGIFAGQYYVIVRFKNIGVWDYQLIDGGSSIAFTDSKSLGNNFFLIPLTQPLFRASYQVKINLNLGSSNPQFIVEYPYSLGATTSAIQELYFPSNQNILFTGMGVGIITIESSEQSLYIQIDNSNIVGAIKIGGSINKSIYMIHYSNQPVFSTYKVNIQNGTNLIEISKSFNQSIISNPFQINDNTGFAIDGDIYTTSNLIQNIKVAQPMKSLLRTNPNIKIFELGFPFGYISGNSINTYFSLSVFEYFSQLNYQFGTHNILPTYSYTPTDTTPPVLLNYNLIIVDGGTRLIYQLKISDAESGVKNFQTISGIYSIGPYLISGDQFNGIVEIEMDYHDTPYIILCNNEGTYKNTTLDSFIFNEDVQPPILVPTTSPGKSLPFSNNFGYLDDIVSISFKFNQLNVTGKSIYNVMTIKLNNFSIKGVLLVKFYPAKDDNPNVNENTPVYYARYNSDDKVQAHQCEFIVPANIGIGELQYSITINMTGPKVIYSDSLVPDYQLIISDSQQYDFIGPIVTKSIITKVININQAIIGWSLTIEDSVNGYFGNGYILVRGSIDMTIRNITAITPITGNNFKGGYRFNFSIPTVCISQTYSIVYAKFIDSQGWVTEFDESNEMGTLMNPFYPLLDQIDFKNLDHQCNDSLISVNGRSELPILNSFTIQTFENTLNVNVLGSSVERIVKFTFTVSHPDGIIINPFPTIYLTSTDQEIVYSRQDQVIPTVSDSDSQFIITMEIPYGFGYAKGILVSLYGIVSNAGIHVGFSSIQLKQASYSYIISTVSTINPANLMLTDSSQLSCNGGIVWFYGKTLNGVTLLDVEYPNGTNTKFVTALNYNTGFSVTLSATEETIKVRAMKSVDIFSNQITIQPFLYKDTTLLINPGTPPPTVTPTITPSPTNKPCKSTCGISNNQGYCSIQGYCICNSPYIGSDCSSTIIIIPPPVINETQPSTEIKIPNEEIKYSSIVSIVSIRELDYNFDQVYSYTFEKWIFNSILNNETTRKYSYFTNITDSQHNVISNITAILEWNSNETVVEFAGQPITLLPSSIKYTIEISKYPFISKLNSLQLIMSTSIIKSSLNDECLTGKSDIEYGNSSSSTIDNQNNSDSNYIELKVDNYLFYGRFIKRALIDGSITSVSNIKLSNDNIEVKLGSSSSKIGINIPWYQSNAIIDPDFSLLVQSNNDDDGNCSDNGLTTAQLAGIIIGSVAVFIILVIIAFAIIYKSSRCFAVKILLYKLFRKSKQ